MNNSREAVVGSVVIKSDITENFLSNVLIAGFDGQYGGCYYWADNVKISSNNAPDILDEIWFSVSLTVSDDDSNETHNITHDSMVESIQKILDETITVSSDIYDSIRDGVKYNDAGYVDAAGADVIVQVATFGEIVYS